MKNIENLLIELLQDKKKRIYLFCGAALALLLIAVILITLLGGSGRKYNRYFNEAQNAYLAGDYSVAEEKLRRAMDLKSTEKAYLLMADIYTAQGETDRAIQILYLGYSHVGGDKIANRLEALKSVQGGASVQPLPQDKVTIGGKAMDASITSLVLNGTRLKAEDQQAIASLLRMESLGLSECGLSDISFLSGLTGLTFLQISDNAVKDLSPISGMKNLKTLYIDYNPIEDLTPLYGLSALRTLSMKGIEVRPEALDALRAALPYCSVYADEAEDADREIRIGGRSFRSDATELTLGGLGLNDISALSACTKLEKLDLRDNQISDLSPLVEMPNLKWLCIWNNEVEDIYPLLSLSGIEHLDADKNAISDISVLEYLPNLQSLWLSNNPLKSIEPLRSLTKLTQLSLAGTDLQDSDLDILMNLTSLEELNIKDNPSLTAGKFNELQAALPNCEITHDELLYTVRFGDKDFRSNAVQIVAESKNVSDLSGLEEFMELQRLDLDGNRISDLSPLRSLTKLKELSLTGNAVSDLSPLSGLKQLQILNLNDNQISNIAPLAGCGAITVLNLSGNSISDLSPLSYLSELSALSVANSNIRDLSALYALPSLKSLDIRGNPLTADDILALQTMLPDCVVLHDIELTPEDLTPVPTQTPISSPEPVTSPTPTPVPTPTPTPAESPRPTPSAPPASGSDLY